MTVVIQPKHQDQVENLFESYFNDLRAYCLRRLAPVEANDAVAEVFLIAWRRRTQIPDGDGARLWLYGVARNIIRHARRSTARRIRLHERLTGLGAPSAESPEHQVVRRSEDTEVLEGLARLGERDQEVLRLRVWEELTAPQIGQVLSISTAAAEKRVARAFQRLERELSGVPSPGANLRLVHRGGE